MIITTILVFLIMLSILVVAHEWGHYFAARRMGVRVDEFAIGFPPRLFSKKDKNGTRWAFNLIPLGGYVKIHGETGEHKDDKDSFGSKSLWARLLILSAGVMMNLVIAAFMFAIGFAIGLPVSTSGEVDEHIIISDERISIVQLVSESPADGVLKLGDELVSIDGREFESAAQVRVYLDTIPEGESTEFTVLRSDEQQVVEISPEYLEEIEESGFGIAFTQVGTGKYPWYLIPFKAIETTFNYTVLIVFAFVGLLINLVTGSGVDAAVAGPIGIAVVTGEMAQLGFVYLLQFAAVLSINLAILNILPFPALDGGRIMFLIVEAIRRKPNSPKIEAMIHNAGFLFLIILVIVVTYRDIVNLF